MSNSEQALEGLVESVLVFSKAVARDLIPEFLEWFVQKGGKVEFPQGQTIETLTEQFIKESAAE